MRNQKIGLAFFVVGAFVLHLYTTLLYLWALVAQSLRHFPLMLPEDFLWLIGFAPPIGALIMVAGCLVYGRKSGR